MDGSFCQELLWAARKCLGCLNRLQPRFQAPKPVVHILFSRAHTACVLGFRVAGKHTFVVARSVYCSMSLDDSCRTLRGSLGMGKRRRHASLQRMTWLLPGKLASDNNSTSRLALWEPSAISGCCSVGSQSDTLANRGGLRHADAHRDNNESKPCCQCRENGASASLA